MPLLDGLSQGVLLFLVASGLTLIYGVMRVLNFAHGGFFMLGAFLTFTLAGGHVQPAWLLLLVIAAAGVLTAGAGLLTEVALFRRLYPLNELNSLLGTFALLLILEGVGRAIWGVNSHSQPQAPEFLHLFHLGPDVPVPAYDLVLLVVGLVCLGSLQWLVNRTEFGRLVRAVAADRQMAGLLGINVTAVFTVMFALGILLAGLGGALVAPLIGLTPDIAVAFIIQAFAVVIIGGFGSISGAFLAALLLGLLNAYLVTFLPAIADFSLYLGMALVLLIRPQGLLGRRAPDAV